MARIATHCCFCGTAYTTANIWPNTCAACGQEIYGNPVPVTIGLCGTKDRLLLQRRNLPGFGFGNWSPPGGFLNRREIPEAGASRETEEETRRTKEEDGQTIIVHPGLIIPPSAFHHYATVGDPDPNLTLMFYEARGVEERIIAWWEESRAHRNQPGLWNEEVQELILATEAEVAELTIAFPIHAEVIKRWFANHHE